MNFLTFDRDKTEPVEDVLATFRVDKAKPTEILEGMSAHEIAEITSEKFIELVRERLAELREQLRQRRLGH